ncbi:MAG TPA: hypothetical protein PKK15_05345, partial [Kouleothrix sp.]|uniref:hypothetical protein n=1 Tax=Kouleothrix sp. TaxID=2779161 RepID=UPI002BED53BF|nr:hypothetical protein [Kouleothrix sp.]
MASQIFSDWQSGSISAREALRALISDLGEVESQLAPLEAEKAELRAQISEVLAELGGRAEADGYRLQLTAPGVSSRYDAKELDQLVSYLQASGDDAIANLILKARKESARAGQLRITPPGERRKKDEEPPF